MKLLAIISIILALLLPAYAVPVGAKPGHCTPGQAKRGLCTLPPVTASPTASPTVNPTASPTATPTASLPATPTAVPTPATGYCSQTVHDSYMVEGPDGHMYPGWHPQRDPSGCYFGHEHGSNPNLWAAADEYLPSFGFVNHHIGHAENHEGFKVFRIRENDGQEWLWTVHIGTSGQGRACNFMHSVELGLADSDGTLLAEVRLLADFGFSEASVNQTGTAYTPDNCPNQKADAQARDSSGVRQISNHSFGQQYEPWRPDLDGDEQTILGFPLSILPANGGGHIAFNNKTSVTTCADINCNTVLLTGNAAMGAYTVIQSTNMFIQPTQTGHFTSGMEGGPGTALPQYIAPGWSRADLTKVCDTPPCNWFLGTDPNVGLFSSKNNGPDSDKGIHTHYNIDGMLRVGN